MAESAGQRRLSFAEVSMDAMVARDVVSETPTDVQHPVMYERAVYIIGLVGVLCVIGIVVLALLGKTIDAGLVAIGASAVSGLVGLLAPRSK
jgi:hypothetical protein